MLEETVTCPDIVYVRGLKNSSTTIPGTERFANQMDPNMFNLLCGEEECATHWLYHSIQKLQLLFLCFVLTYTV